MGGLVRVQPAGISAPDQQTSTSASNAAAVITLAAEAGYQHHLRSVTWSYAGGTVTGRLTIASPAGSTLLDIDITTAGPGQIVLEPMKGEDSSEVVVTLHAGGTGVTGKLNIAKQTHPDNL